MKINTQLVLKNFKDLPLKDEEGNEMTLGKALANIIISTKEGGKMKLFVLAKNLFEAKGNLEVDDSDLSLIKNSVKSTEIYTVLVTGQLELILENIKDESNLSESKSGEK